jgi:ABC-type sugar transport system ATPase subunit
VEVLHGVDFLLRPGCVHALMGENGAGKSTLVKVIAGIHRCDAGEILLEGVPVAIDSPLKAREMAYR